MSQLCFLLDYLSNWYFLNNFVKLIDVNIYNSNRHSDHTWKCWISYSLVRFYWDVIYSVPTLP